MSYVSGVCQVCGKSFTRKYHGNPRTKHKLCSTACGRRFKNTESFKQFQTKLSTGVKDLFELLGRAPTFSQLKRYLQVSCCTLTNHHYTSCKIAQMCGDYSRKPYKKYYIDYTYQQLLTKCKDIILRSQFYTSLEAVAQTLKVRRDWLSKKIDINALRKQLGKDNLPKRDIQAIKNQLINWLKTQKHYTSLRILLDTNHIDYNSTFVPLGCTIEQLNKLAGFKKPTASWAEQHLYFSLLQYFDKEDIKRQAKFPQLRSKKGYLLRYDFKIESMKVLIQVDGQHHTNPKAKYYSLDLVQRDKKKQKFAEDKGFRFFRIPYKGPQDFDKRVCRLIRQLGIVKPVELLEPLQSFEGALQGDQQPSRERRYETEGSETIEKEIQQEQLDFNLVEQSSTELEAAGM